jgi:hypothetical protein
VRKGKTRMSSVNNNPPPKPQLNSATQQAVQEALTQSTGSSQGAALAKAQEQSGLSPQDFERAMDASMKQNGDSKKQIGAANSALNSVLPGADDHEGKSHHAHGGGGGTSGASGTSAPPPTPSTPTTN